MEKSQIASTKFQINLKDPLDPIAIGCARGDIVLGFDAFRYLDLFFGIWNLTLWDLLYF